MATEFRGNDQAYLGWVAGHPNGYVLNTYSTLDSSYLMLHRTACSFITEIRGRGEPGGFTERQYMKVCDDSVSGIRDWVTLKLGAAGLSIQNCQFCHPV